MGKEEQANTSDCSQKFEEGEGGDTGGALMAEWFHTFSLFLVCYGSGIDVPLLSHDERLEASSLQSCGTSSLLL